MFRWKGIRKNSNSQKVKSQKVYFSTFLLPSHLFDLSGFRLFFFPLDSQRFKFCTFRCAFSVGKASGKNSKSQQVKAKKYTFRLFDFSSSLSPFRLFGFSAILLPSRSQRFNFCTFSCACSAGKASGKNSKSQQVKAKKYTFRLFDFSSSLSPFRLFGFSAFLLPSRSQGFNFCTFSCACSAGKASGKNSKSQKMKSQKVYFSTFRNSQRRLFTFRLFAFRLFDFQNETFPLFDFSFFDFLKLIFDTFRLEPCSTSFLPSMMPPSSHLCTNSQFQATASFPP